MSPSSPRWRALALATSLGVLAAPLAITPAVAMTAPPEAPASSEVDAGIPARSGDEAETPSASESPTKAPNDGAVAEDSASNDAVTDDGTTTERDEAGADTSAAAVADDEGITPIAEIQGTGAASPLVDQTVTTRGVVTAAYPDGGFNGYYIQTAGTGGDVDLSAEGASDALFVYSPSTVGQVAIGDLVDVTGKVSEYYNLTQISVTAASSLDVIAKDSALPEPARVSYPRTEEERERLEGMLVQPTAPMTVTDVYDANSFGQIGLVTGDTPLVTPTVAGLPGTAEHTAALTRADEELVLLDDGATANYATNAAAKSVPLPYVSTTDPVRVGATATFTSPVILDYRYEAWSFQPQTRLTGSNASTVQPVSFENTRTEAPAEVGGAATVATFNVLNYFTTTGDALSGCTFYTDRASNPITVNRGCDARGAANAENRERQEAKIVAAINALDADVVSLEEIENSAAFGADRDEALNALVAALNTAAGSARWSAVPSPAAVPEKEDVIRTAFIYRSDSIAPVGESEILTDSPAFDNAREPNAQAFKLRGAADSDAFIVIANHFKSKGSTGATGENVDAGQGAFNPDRVRQATALVEFADQVSDDRGTDAVLLVGDFNSYNAEDPLQVLEDADYTNVSAATGKYSYAFEGAVGSLDHIFASPAAADMVTGADIWNINSVESIALEYSRHNYNVTNFYDESLYRSSDHDPVLVGLNPGGAPAESTQIDLLNLNDFHGRIDANTVKFAGTIEGIKAQNPDGTVLLSAGDNIGASLFASSSLADQPTIDVLNALDLKASAVGNHEFDQGYKDLIDRVINNGDNASFDYLGANVYHEGTTDPALDEYSLVEVGDLTVGVVGVVTDETPTLVAAAGVAGLEFGDPVEAMNRVAAQLTDGDAENGEADIIVAEYHEGAGAGTPDGSSVEEEVAGGGVFADIVTKTSPEVDVIFTGHTHKQYAWTAPVPGDSSRERPIIQTGNYGEFIGHVSLLVDADGTVTLEEAANVPRVTTDDADLIKAYPAVAQVNTIVEKALAESALIGNQKIGEQTADITRAFKDGNTDDRASESAMGTLVANSLRDTLASTELGGAEIGIVNPGGMRSDLIRSADGSITYAQANAVLPFVNNLWTTTLTGEQFVTALEQQWQTDANGQVPSRPYLQLGLSDNVSYTFDESRERGDRITSVTVDGEPIDLDREYRIGSFSFLLNGGDNFRVFSDGKGTRDSGLVDRDGWIEYLSANSPVSPATDRRSVAVTGIPEAPVAAGSELTFGVGQLSLTSLAAPASTQLVASMGDTELASVPVADGTTSITVPVPADASGAVTLVLTAEGSGTRVQIPLQVTGDSGTPGEPSEAPTAADESALTAELEGQISAPDELVRGEKATITVGDEFAGDWVSAWLFSEPVALSDGWVQVSESGTVTVTVPEDAPLGAHRVVVQDAENSVLGWQAATVVAADGGSDGGSTGGSDGGSTGSADSGSGSTGSADGSAGASGSNGSAGSTGAHGSGSASQGSGSSLAHTGQEAASLMALTLLLLGAGACMMISRTRNV